jgi:hypothetical protein
VLSLTLQRYCEQLLSGRVAVSARDVAILMGLAREVRRDAERDRLAVARLTFTVRRLVAQLGHRAWRWPTPGRDSQLGGGIAADRPRPVGCQKSAWPVSCSDDQDGSGAS